MRVEIIQDVDTVAGGLVAAADTTALTSGPALLAAAEAARSLGLATIMAHTPVGDESGDTASVHLRDTTAGIAEGTDTQSSATFTQTKTIPIRGDDVSLAQVLTQGRRSGYDVYPVAKSALYWPGADHPYAHSRPGPAAPNPYIQDAMDAMEPEIALIAREVGVTIGGTVLTTLNTT